MSPPFGIDEVGCTNKFKRRYRRLDRRMRAEVDSLIREIVEDRLSPGRNVSGHDGLYELRVNYHFRLAFRLRDGHIAELTTVGPHDVLGSPT